MDSNIANLLGMLAPPDGAPARLGLTTVSQAWRLGWAPHCAIAQVIYNGVDIAAILFRAEPNPEPSLLFAGRISPEKGVEDALAIAERERATAGAGDVSTRATSSSASRQSSRGWASASVYLAVAREELYRLMGKARASCTPHWDEPFGLVACEAQAAAAPVIGYRRGEFSQVVADGEGWRARSG